MCGLVAIFAYADAAPPVDGRELLAVREAMAPRGPHGAGTWIAPDARIGLAHRRLAIIDRDPRADQPMVSPCGRWHLVYNGEIYNWRELRAELEREGVAFRTASDTEVLLHWFARRGVEGLARLRGMYAFALWDAVERRLWLARDPFGVKPLWWHDDGGTLRAASQVRALLAGGCIADTVEPAGVVGFLLWGSVPEPWSTVAGVYALAPGHVLEVGPDGPGRPRPFADLGVLIREWEDGPEPQPAGVVRALEDSVRAHLEADVPVGLFLSSGVDSCALAAMLARLGRAGATVAVTLGFDEFRGRPEDEVPLAAAVARRYGLRHVVRRVGRAEFAGELPRFLAVMDQPTVDGLNTWFVVKAAREQGLEVALSGLGGDELLGGYPSFRRIPRLLRTLRPLRALPGAASLWRVSVEALSAAGMVAPHPKLAGLLAHGGDLFGAYRLVRGLYLPHELPKVVDPDLARVGLSRLVEQEATVADARGPRSPFARVSHLEASRYMRSQLLRDSDWASMAQSLEVRVPLVDVPLWRALLPAAARRPGKEAFARAIGLPAEVIERPKTGFATPIESWLDGVTVEDRPAHGPRGREPWARRWARWLLRQDVTPLPGLALLPATGASAAVGTGVVGTV